MNAKCAFQVSKALVLSQRGRKIKVVTKKWHRLVKRDPGCRDEY